MCFCLLIGTHPQHYFGTLQPMVKQKEILNSVQFKSLLFTQPSNQHSCCIPCHVTLPLYARSQGEACVCVCVSAREKCVLVVFMCVSFGGKQSSVYNGKGNSGVCLCVEV